MRTTTVACCTGQAKGGSIVDWERVNWVTALWPGKQNETLQSNSDFPNYSSTACLHVYSIWAVVAAGDILSTIFSTKWSCQLLWLERKPLSKLPLSVENSLLPAGENT